jgi:hypothetical protein
MSATRPLVLFVYFTVGRIELTDPRYADRFSRFPFKHPYLLVSAASPRNRTDTRPGHGARRRLRPRLHWVANVVAKALHADPLILRSFMESDLAGRVLAGKRFAAIVVSHRYLGIRKGDKVVNGIHFIAAGGPIGSMLALMSYFGTGVVKDRYLGVKIPPANLQPSYVRESQAFAGELADSVT